MIQALSELRGSVAALGAWVEQQPNQGARRYRDMEFVQAKFFTQADRGPQEIERIIWHTIENPAETGSSAENCAQFFANLPASTPVEERVSSHYVIDNNTEVQCVKDEDIANHAFGDNEGSLGFELSGEAGQSFSEWRDDYSDKVVERACVLAARKCKAYGIPPRWLTNAEVADRVRGFATHEQISDEFGAGIRSDPGEHFPYKKVAERVKFHLERLERVKFLIVDGRGGTLAESAPVGQGSAELERLNAFFASNRRKLLNELRADRDAGWRRVKA
jgi:N-acetylmuramoyl-L-alanine amidase